MDGWLNGWKEGKGKEGVRRCGERASKQPLQLGERSHRSFPLILEQIVRYILPFSRRDTYHTLPTSPYYSTWTDAR